MNLAVSRTQHRRITASKNKDGGSIKVPRPGQNIGTETETLYVITAMLVFFVICKTRFTALGKLNPMNISWLETCVMLL